MPRLDHVLGPFVNRTLCLLFDSPLESSSWNFSQSFTIGGVKKTLPACRDHFFKAGAVQRLHRRERGCYLVRRRICILDGQPQLSHMQAEFSRKPRGAFFHNRARQICNPSRVIHAIPGEPLPQSRLPDWWIDSGWRPTKFLINGCSLVIEYLSALYLS